MANHRSAEKRARQNRRRRTRNAAIKSALRTATKKLVAAMTRGSKDEAAALLQATCRAWDKGVSKNVVHPNTAARKKSRLTRQVNSLVAGGTIGATPSPSRKDKRA